MKKVLSFILVTMMLLASLGSSIASATGDTNDSIDWNQHQTYSWWLSAFTNDYYTTYADNPVAKYIQEKFNVTLEFQQPASGTEQDALSLMFGTGEYADVIEITRYTGSVSQLYEDGIILDIAEYLEYMPNFSALMGQNEGLRKYAYNDEGRILKLPVCAEEPELIWAGFVYRHDILEKMTDGNVQFPSGNDAPTTLEDWDYMLPLFDQYFKQEGLVDYASLIIPWNGYYHYGELGTSFGFNSNDFYVEDGVVKHGLLDKGLFDYLTKMNEWFEAGYIYQDFASRVNDMFFMPNSALVYSGAVGCWYSMVGTLGQNLGEDFDVRPISSPLVEGIPGTAFLNRNPPPYEGSGSTSVVSAKAPDIPKLLSMIDFMYSKEGGMLWKYGVTAEQIASDDFVMASNGLEDGMYHFEDDTIVLNPLLDQAGGSLTMNDLIGQRFPGWSYNVYDWDVYSEVPLHAHQAWGAHEGGSKTKLPLSLTYSSEDERFIADTKVTITDYMSQMIPKYIMGTETLDEASFTAFVEQLKAYKIEDMVRITQDAYDRYTDR